MKKSVTTLLAIIVLALQATQAQDIHLSHLHASPMLLNPAMTGLFNGDFRFTANAKSQWNSLTNGYRTVVGAADFKPFSLGNGDMLGAGLQVYSDVAGDLEFTTQSTGLYLSVLKSLDGRGEHFLAIGMQNALVTNSVDYSKIEAFDNEPAILNGADDRRTYWDFTLGGAWFYTFDRDKSIHVGISFAHLNKPNVSFFEGKEEAINDPSLLLYRRILVHGGAELKVGKRSFIKPSFIFTGQGPHREFTLGSFFKYTSFKSRPNSPGASIHLGGWLRWHAARQEFGTDAVVAAVRMDYKKTFITFSFDINISSLSQVSYGRGGPELSLIKILDFERQRSRSSKRVKCPDF